MSKAKPHPVIKLGNNLPESELADTFREHGRLQIPGILKPRSADAIHDSLVRMGQWSLVFKKDGQHVDTDAEAFANWSALDRLRLEALIHQQAADGFQYYYSTVPIYDIYHKGLLPGHFVNRIFEFLNSDEFLRLMRVVTDDESITFADGQATRYAAGNFLTRHNDDVDHKNRRVAYVLNLTPEWNADWGGALQFFDPKGNIECGFTPAYNVLNIFQIPASHSVEFVAPFATGARYSVTGWLRSGKDPMLRD
jgi:Rps23 Pro-64 3,4-dihydroxylase Tpa1-like proline 4-hydroxylase